MARHECLRCRCPVRARCAAFVAARAGRRHRDPDSRPSRGAQRAVGSHARRTRRGVGCNRRRSRRARGRAGGERGSILGRPRHEGTHRASHRHGSWTRVFQAGDGGLQRGDADDRASAAAGDRRGGRRRERGGLSAGRKLRPRGGVERGAFRHPGREYRPVLLDPDGRAFAQRIAQARHEDAAHRRHGLGRGSSEHWPGQLRGRARRRTRRGARARPQGCRQIDCGREARQGGVLPPARNGPRRRLCATRPRCMVENMLARDAEEGIGAFIEKREPRWEDR